MITDMSSMPTPSGFSLSASGVLHKARDDGNVLLGQLLNISDLPQPMAEASLAWSNAKLHLAWHLPGPHGGNVHPAHYTAAAQEASSPHLSAVHETVTSVVLPKGGAWSLLYGMNTMYSQPSSQAPVSISIILASPKPSHEDPMVTSHHTTQHRMAVPSTAFFVANARCLQPLSQGPVSLPGTLVAPGTPAWPRRPRGHHPSPHPTQGTQGTPLNLWDPLVGNLQKSSKITNAVKGSQLAATSKT